MPGSNPAERAAVYDAMNETIARLHRFDPAQIGLGDFGRGENYVARQVERWSKQYRASETEKIDAMERLIEWLPTAHSARRAGAAGARRLPARQSDRRQGFSRRRRRARLGIVDARRPARRFHLSPDGLAHAAFGKRGRHRLAGRPRSCARSAFPRWRTTSMLTSRAPGSIRGPHLPAYLAYNFFRIAAILQGIIGRVRDGTATSRIRAGQGRDDPPARREGVGVRARGGRALTITVNKFLLDAGAFNAIDMYNIHADPIALPRDEKDFHQKRGRSWRRDHPRARRATAQAAAASADA